MVASLHLEVIGKTNWAGKIFPAFFVCLQARAWVAVSGISSSREALRPCRFGFFRSFHQSIIEYLRWSHKHKREQTESARCALCGNRGERPQNFDFGPLPSRQQTLRADLFRAQDTVPLPDSHDQHLDDRRHDGQHTICNDFATAVGAAYIVASRCLGSVASYVGRGGRQSYAGRGQAASGGEEKPRPEEGRTVT